MTLLLLGSAIVISACAGKNINQSSRLDENVLVRKWVYPSSSLFSEDAGDRGYEYSNPLILDNTLIFGSRKGGITSLYPSSQQVRWKQEIPKGVWSEILADQKSLFFGGGDGNLYSISQETGKIQWTYDLRNPAISRPTNRGGRLFVTTTDDTVYALDSSTGKWLWHYRRKTSAVATVHGASIPLVDGNEVIVGLSDGYVVALSVFDGKLKWEKKIHSGIKFTDVDAHPVLVEGVIYIPSYDGALYALKRTNGEVLWRYDSGGSKQIAIEDDKIYLPSSDGKLVALMRENGRVLWTFEMDGGTPTDLVLTKKHILFGSNFQYLYALDKATGKLASRFNVGWGSGFNSSLAHDSSKNMLYALSGSGNLYAFLVK